MGLFDRFRSTPVDPAAQAIAEERRQTIVRSLQAHQVPASIRSRLEASGSGTAPWLATLTPAELRAVRSHGIRPIAAVSATCWIHYGWSWTLGHAEGWETALRRLRDEARAAGANAVLDVKLRTVRLRVENSMDFSLVGTAVRVDRLSSSVEPIVATVPTLEFVKLLDADVVPTGIAIGAHYNWLQLPRSTAEQLKWSGNTEFGHLSNFFQDVRRQAHLKLRKSAEGQGNGVLAHVNFSQIFDAEGPNETKRYLARHIVVATTIDARRDVELPMDIRFAVDMCAGSTPLTRRQEHHQSYGTNDIEGAI